MKQIPSQKNKMPKIAIGLAALVLCCGIAVSYFGAEYLANLLTANSLSAQEHASLEGEVYSWQEIPYSGGPGKTAGNYPFESIEWMAPGYFVVNGDCNDGRNDTTLLEKGGMYIFDEDDGVHLQTRDTCLDSAVKMSGCYEAGGCSKSNQIHPFGNGNFVLDTNAPNNSGISRGPLVYNTGSGTNTAAAQKVFFNDFGWDHGTSEKVNEIVGFDNIAVANNLMIGVSKIYKGSQAATDPRFGEQKIYEYKTAIYDLPGLELLQEKTNSTPYSPIVGIGNIFLAAEKSTVNGVGTKFNPLVVYRMPSKAEVANGKSPEVIQKFNSLALSNYTLDSVNSDRIALSWQGQKNNIIQVYEIGAAGLTPVADLQWKMPRKNNSAERNFQLGQGFAVAGEYLVYGDCDFKSSCEPVIKKGNQTISADAIPADSTGKNQILRSVALSPNGMMLVSGYSRDGDNGRLYLYKIENTSGSNNNTGGNNSTGNPNTGGNTGDSGSNTGNTPADTNQTDDQNSSGGNNTDGTNTSDSSDDGSGNTNQTLTCSAAGGSGCTQNVSSGEIQLGNAGDYSCSTNDFCVDCAAGYQWSGGSLGNCTLNTNCVDSGGNGCTFSIGAGEQSLNNSGPGAYGCTGFKSYCVECQTGYAWNGNNCELSL